MTVALLVTPVTKEVSVELFQTKHKPQFLAYLLIRHFH
jgi:hypothetical protein